MISRALSALLFFLNLNITCGWAVRGLCVCVGCACAWAVRGMVVNMLIRGVAETSALTEGITTHSVLSQSTFLKFLFCQNQHF